MKKILLTLVIVAISFYAKSQIALERTLSYYTNGESDPATVLIDHEMMYAIAHYKSDLMNIDSIKIYNWNHSLYKAIPFIVCNNCGTSGNCSFGTGPFSSYVSTALFDSDSTTIDYMYLANDTTTCQGDILEIRNEIGTLLLHEDSIYAAGVVPTPLGFKLELSGFGGNVKIYSLPGSIPCVTCNGGTLEVRGVESPSLGNLFNYPNPTFDKTTIQYSLPQGINNGELVFYSLTGVEMKRFKVDRNFHDLQLSTRDLPAGTYFYQLQTASGSLAKKMIVIK